MPLSCGTGQRAVTFPDTQFERFYFPAKISSYVFRREMRLNQLVWKLSSNLRPSIWNMVLSQRRINSHLKRGKTT